MSIKLPELLHEINFDEPKKKKTMVIHWERDRDALVSNTCKRDVKLHGSIFGGKLNVKLNRTSQYNNHTQSAIKLINIHESEKSIWFFIWKQQQKMVLRNQWNPF